MYVTLGRSMLTKAAHILMSIRVRPEGVRHLRNGVCRGASIPRGLATNGLTVLSVSLVQISSVSSKNLPAFSIRLRFLNCIQVQLVLLRLEGHDFGFLIFHEVLMLHGVLVPTVVMWSMTWVGMIAALTLIGD